MKIDETYLETYLETHYEVVSEINCRLESNNKLVDKRFQEFGTGGLYMLAKEITDAFESQYKDIVWGEELDWMDTLDGFLKDYFEF